MKAIRWMQWILMVLLLAAAAPTPAADAALPAPPEPPSPYRLVFSDPFSQPALDARWSWVREDPALWSLTSHPGALDITGSGSIYQTVGNDQKNILVTPAPSGDFRVTTSVSSTPTENNHGPALLIYQDDDNYIELSQLYHNELSVSFRKEVNGVSETHYFPVSTGNIFLRILKEGDSYHAFYSVDGGQTWAFVYTFHGVALASPKVALSVHLGQTTLALTASFDFITVEQIRFNTTQWVDGFNLPTLESAWSWVREDPALWRLDTSTGFLRINASGSLFQAFNDQKNILVKPLPAGDYRITTRVQAMPLTNEDSGSLLVYQDDDNYIELGKSYSSAPAVILRKEVGGVTTTVSVPVDPYDVYLRLVKEGNTFTGWYSLDGGGTWDYVGSVSVPLVTPRLGLGARSSGLEAGFGYVRVEIAMEKTYLPMTVK